MPQAPHIVVSTGTGVPGDPSDPLSKLLMAVLQAASALGAGKSAEHFIAGLAYKPLKDLGDCIVHPLEKLGFADRQKSVDALKVRLRGYHRRYPKAKVILVGQSQGALVAAEVVLDPEFNYVVAVVMAGGPFAGSNGMHHPLLFWSKAFPGVRQMMVGDDSLKDLAARIKKRWPKTVVPVIVSDPDDALVSEKSAHALKFPKGVTPLRISVGGPAQAEGQRKVIPGVMSHIYMCRRRSLLSVIRELRENLTPEQLDQLQGGLTFLSTDAAA